MTELTNNASQTVLPGQPVVFNTIVTSTGCDTCCSRLTNSVKMRQNGRYIISFSGNITNPTTAGVSVQLSIALGGTALPEGAMISTPGAVNTLNNVSKTLGIANCCCDFDRVTVINSGATSLVVGAYPTLVVTEVDS